MTLELTDAEARTVIVALALFENEITHAADAAKSQNLVMSVDLLNARAKLVNSIISRLRALRPTTLVSEIPSVVVKT